ncbi:MAG: hypothetical protein SH850_08645 [Planctomycetaceae bacterium]|nr:hypothetical protein [Planctomycetaceae bacterium]
MPETPPVNDPLPRSVRWFAPWLWMSQRAWIITAVLLGLYVTPYAVLSRLAYAEADKYDSEGFYYLSPQNTNEWQFWNRTCVNVFCPLNIIDRTISNGRYPACDPLFEFDFD